MKSIVSFFGDSSEIFTDLNRRAAEYAAGLGMTYTWVRQEPFSRESVIRALREADAGIIDVEPYNDEIFSQMGEKCKLLVRFGVGYDKVDLAAAAKRHIAVARTTGANTPGVAEMALTLILAARRKLKLNQKCVETGKWAKNVARATLGSTIGILGFGAIGQALADMLKGFDCRILAYDPYPKTDVMQRKGVTLVGLEELFRESDAVSIHVPYSESTHGLVGARLLSLMKPTAVVVNTSRGNIVDEAALYDALTAGKLGGAALDVFSSEPLPLDSPLLGLDNVILTPHVSSQTVESLWNIYKMAVDIAADHFAGKDSPHILNPDYKTL